MADVDEGTEARVEATLAALTLEEKARLTGGDDVWHLPAIERLGIGRFKVSDGPSGVRGQYVGTRRSLSFPCGTAAGATWDVDLIERYGHALGQEAVAKGVHVLLGPTVCIPRTPLGGRTFESFAEDPHLAARATVAYIDGVQAEGVGCCVKHFACNDQEHERMSISVEIDDATLREVHLVPFEAAVRDAGVWSIMSAYNRLRGTYASEHPELLTTILRGDWGFDGAVISDWFANHSTVEASTAGLDIEMPGPPSWFGKKLAKAVEDGELDAAVLDEQVRRILRLLDRTGVRADLSGDAGELPPEPEEGQADDPERRALARELAVAGSVLLTNDGLLPIDPAGVQRVAVIGPNATRLEVGGGGSAAVVAHRHLSFVEELRDRLPGVEVVHEPGCDLDRGAPPIDARLLPDGFRVEHFDSAAGLDDGREPVATDAMAEGFFIAMGRPAPGVSTRDYGLRAVATFVPPVSGTWTLGLANAGLGRLYLDGELVVENVEPNGSTFFVELGFGPVTAPVELEAGTVHQLMVELRTDPTAPPLVGFQVSAGMPLPSDARARAVAAARDADAVVVVVGSNRQWESEGHDRHDLSLVGEQDDLVRDVLAANPRTAVVVNTGAPVLLPWADDAAAVLHVWYPGEEGAPALADVVTGLAAPSGRLPLTFPARIEDTAAFGHYPGSEGKVTYGEGRLVGYRHLDAHGLEPAFCFGHGLTYTTFAYGEPTLDAAGDGDVVVTVPVTNTGSRAGREVVQLYVAPLDPLDPADAADRPVQELHAFAKVAVAPGETVAARLVVAPRAFAHWDTAAGGWTDGTGSFELRIGSSSRAIAHRLSLKRE